MPDCLMPNIIQFIEFSQHVLRDRDVAVADGMLLWITV